MVVSPPIAIDHATHSRQRAGGDLQQREYQQQRRHHTGEGAFREVAGQPIQVAAPVDDFVDARLEKQDREQRADE
jgi:hypothetical protein